MTKDKENLKNWSAQNKALMVVCGLFVLLIVIISIMTSNSPTNGKDGGSTHDTSHQSNKHQTISTSKPTSTAGDKTIASSINVQSTGYSHYDGKYHYGFIISNAKRFTGKINITLDGVNGDLPDAVVFTENNLAAGMGDAGEVGWSGLYDKYSYTVTIGNNTYKYSGGKITNLE